MTDSGQSEPAAAAAAAPLQQPFRFMDLPMELRFTVLGKLMDNPKNAIKFTAPKNLDVEEVHLDGMYYPSLLKVNKSIRDEYWPLCLRRSVLWIVYACTESTQPDTENSEEEKPTMPPLSDWVMIPTRILERVADVIFKFQADWTLPEIGKKDGVNECSPHNQLLIVLRPLLWYCRLHRRHFRPSIYRYMVRNGHGSC